MPNSWTPGRDALPRKNIPVLEVAMPPTNSFIPGNGWSLVISHLHQSAIFDGILLILCVGEILAFRLLQTPLQ